MTATITENKRPNEISLQRLLGLLILFVLSGLNGYSAGLKQTDFLFQENKGQIRDASGNRRSDIQFLLEGNDAQIFIRENGISYQFHYIPFNSGESRQDIYSMEMHLTGINPEAEWDKISPAGEIRHDARLGVSNIRSYQTVVCRNVYPKIDWVLSVKGGQFKHEFLVHPGGDPANIRMAYDHHTQLYVEEERLIIESPAGKVIEDAPVSLQGESRIPTGFRVRGAEVSFELSDYDRHQELLIDPGISWATYFGGSGFDSQGVCATDGSGNVFLAGITSSTSNIAYSGGHQLGYGGGSEDIFLAKLDSSGQRIWSTYFGGEGAEANPKIKADRWGNVYLTGVTYSTTQIATAGSHQVAHSNPVSMEAFLAKFNANGQLVWSTYFGGYDQDNSSDIAIDSMGNIYLTGTTYSDAGIAYSGWQNVQLHPDPAAYLVKFDSMGQRLWGTYFQSPIPLTRSRGLSVAIDSFNQVYLSGYAEDGLATALYSGTYSGGFDAYIARFNPSGTLIWCTYLGGPQNEDDLIFKIDAYNNLYLMGQTQSATGIATGGLRDTITGSNNTYLARFSDTGAKRWATYLPFSYIFFSGGMTTLTNGHVAVAGALANTTGFVLNPLTNPLLPYVSNVGGFAEYDSTGHMVWGDLSEAHNIYRINGMAGDSYGNLFLSGDAVANRSDSLPFSTHQTTHGGDYDCALVKIDLSVVCQNADQPVITASQDTVCPGQPVVLTVQSGNLNNATAWHWYHSGCGNQFIQTGNSCTIYPVSDTTVYVLGAGGCAQSGVCDTITIHTFPAILNNVIQASQTLCQPGIPALITGALPSGGNGQFTYSWETSTDSMLWYSISGGTSPSFQPGLISSRVLFRRNVSSFSQCPDDQSNVVVMEFLGASANTIGNNQTVGPNANPSPLSGSNPGLNTQYQWQVSTDSVLWNPIPDATLSAYQPTQDTMVRWFRRIMTPSGCSPSTSNVVRIVYFPGNLIVSPPQVICEGQNVTLQVTSLSPTPVMFYFWSGPMTFEMNASFTILNASAFYSGTYNVTAYFMDGSSESRSTRLTVLPVSGNSVTGSQTIAANTVPAQLTGSSLPGYQYQWQSSTNGSVWNSISGATDADYVSPALPATTYFRRLVQPGVCDSFSNVIVVQVNANYLFAPPVFSCQRDVIYLNVMSLYNSPIVSYLWTGPMGFSSTVAAPSISRANTHHSGTYTVMVQYADGAQAVTTQSVLVYARSSVLSNAPVCEGNTLMIRSIPANAGNYLWTGPNGFSSTLDSVVIPNASVIHSGIYSLQVTYPPGTCPNQSFQVTAQVFSIDNPTSASNSPVCQGNALYLSGGAIPVGASVLWHGPQGFSSIAINPSISNVQPAQSGNYTLQVTHPVCGTSVAELPVSVSTRPNNFLSSNQPVCAGGELRLSSSISPGASYSWSGPLGFTFAGQVAILNPANKLMNGVYTVTTTAPGCPPSIRTISVRVEDSLSISPGSNSPVCSGGVLNLTTNNVAFGSYLWLGPAGFSAAGSSVSRTSARSSMSGVYTLIVSSPCGVLSSTLSVTVYPAAQEITVSPNQVLCIGAPLTLTGTPVAGTSMMWSKTGLTSVSGSSAFFPTVNMSHNGTFTYTIGLPGCGSITRNVNVTVSDTTNVSGSVSSPLCAGAPLYMNAGFISRATYLWQAPDGFSSTVQNPSRNQITVLNAGLYSLTVTLPACPAVIRTFPVIVNVCREQNEQTEQDAFSIPDGDESIEWVVYPIPFTRELNIQLDEQAEYWVQLTDAKGSVVLQQQGSVGTTVIGNLQDMPSGIYTLTIVRGDRIHSRRIIKH